MKTGWSFFWDVKIDVKKTEYIMQIPSSMISVGLDAVDIWVNLFGIFGW